MMGYVWLKYCEVLLVVVIILMIGVIGSWVLLFVLLGNLVEMFNDIVIFIIFVFG